jgi:hypothetical protein
LEDLAQVEPQVMRSDLLRAHYVAELVEAEVLELAMTLREET